VSVAVNMMLGFIFGILLVGATLGARWIIGQIEFQKRCLRCCRHCGADDLRPLYDRNDCKALVCGKCWRRQ
jgi:hypothetical protein